MSDGLNEIDRAAIAEYAMMAGIDDVDSLEHPKVVELLKTARVGADGRLADRQAAIEMVDAIKELKPNWFRSTVDATKLSAKQFDDLSDHLRSQRGVRGNADSVNGAATLDASRLNDDEFEAMSDYLRSQAPDVHGVYHRVDTFTRAKLEDAIERRKASQR